MANFCAPVASPPDDGAAERTRRVRAALAHVLGRDDRGCTRCNAESRRVVALSAHPLTTEDLAVICQGCGPTLREWP